MAEGARALPTIGFIGLGRMGGPMAANLAGAGYRVVGYDILGERLAERLEEWRRASDRRHRAAGSAAEVVRECEVVLISLRSSEIFVQVTEGELVAHARAGQVFVDMGTTAPPETRRVAAALAERGAALVDAPVSGGPEYARRGCLLIFVGGEEAALARVRPVLEVLGDPDRITHCGPPGAGQVVKGCNQLVMGLVAAAHVEALAYGVRAGVDAEVVMRALRGKELWRRCFAAVAEAVVEGRGDEVDVKYPELHYFLAEAERKRFPLPLTEAVFAFGARARRLVRDSMDRPTPSFWGELLERGMEEAPGG